MLYATVGFFKDKVTKEMHAERISILCPDTSLSIDSHESDYKALRRNVLAGRHIRFAAILLFAWSI
jgi:hypothetical protein